MARATVEAATKVSAHDRSVEVKAAGDAVACAQDALKRTRESAAVVGGAAERRVRRCVEGILCSAEVSL